MTMKWLKTALIVASMGLAFWLGMAITQRSVPVDAEAEARANAMIHELRPGFLLPDLHGQLFDARQWDGKVLVVNFWATWCPPCRREMPDFVELQHAYASQGVQFVGIALDEPGAVQQFVQEMNVNYPLLLGGVKATQVSEAYGNSDGVLPYTAIVDRQGRIAYIHRGFFPGDQAKKVILSLL
ncbi:MAG: TlpA family protein disulfide reductase [Gammaproteobacteria bacterium]|nr:TlpA family protein disulfide reductase [Gammaproteobacteria bacterium]